MFFSRISFRITLWFTAFFLIGAMILFGLTSYFLHSSLQKKDQDLLEAKFQDYSALLARDGVQGLQLRTSRKEIPDAGRFLVRYQSESGQTLLLHAPESMEILDKSLTLSELDERLKSAVAQGTWISIKGHEYGDDLEVLSRKLPSGDVLQIGKDTEDREAFFEQFARSFLLGALPVLILALLAGRALSGTILRPIRWLTKTIQEIRAGKSASRVSVRGNGDELDRLSHLFNDMQDQNERLVRGMRDTLDHVAHDLRTPIMRLQGSAQRALEKATAAEARSHLHEALVDCQENSESIQKMLDAIMDISEAETGTMSLKMEPINSASIVESVVDLYGFVAEEKNIILATEIEANDMILADKTRLLQALANLLDNAIKYSPAGSVVKIRSRKRDGWHIFEVIDQGAGISESEGAKIWDRLYRGDQSRSTRGLGLGLSLVRAIAKAHSGTAQVESVPTGGSCFQIEIPADTSKITQM